MTPTRQVLPGHVVPGQVVPGTVSSGATGLIMCPPSLTP
jgi:hypothetical protein